jgi:hypothetical protein
MMVAALAISGCWPWHKSESPQQQYAEALMRGNSMQASNIWLNMSPEDRMKFIRGDGINQGDAAEKAAKQEIQQHQNDQPDQDSDESDDTAQRTVPTPFGASLGKVLTAQPPSDSN